MQTQRSAPIPSARRPLAAGADRDTVAAVHAKSRVTRLSEVRQRPQSGQGRAVHGGPGCKKGQCGDKAETSVVVLAEWRAEEWVFRACAHRRVADRAMVARQQSTFLEQLQQSIFLEQLQQSNSECRQFVAFVV